MQFLYIPNPTQTITITGENHKYLFKVRRIKKNELVKVRNLKDDYLYIYEITDINKKEAHLILKEKIHQPNRPKKYLHIGWCIIEPKNIEKVLPSLNEIGVSKISFIYCDFSQKNFKIKEERLTKILINSSQQCGRSDIIQIEFYDSLDNFLEKYDSFALDFDGEEIECNKTYENVVIGCEGGFSKREKKLFSKKIKLKGFILRSESAAAALSSKILL
ncbi:MAG: 16S rRNA (uracil(1498)-N(3))-methyltransferase [Epsilonproteobacteria bacterium]|nr:16S rRNA (uracil(1498)-N(3))-methyltransferase [Campylobacterota bacterium]